MKRILSIMVVILTIACGGGEKKTQEITPPPTPMYVFQTPTQDMLDSGKIIFDTSYLSLIPNITIMMPKDSNELIRMLDFSKDFNGPLVIKYFKGDSYTINDDIDDLFEPELIVKGENTLIITTGRLVKEAYDASEINNSSIYPSIQTMFSYSISSYL